MFITPISSSTNGTIRAGLPAAVHVPATGPPEVWSLPGPFLGTADTTYQSLGGTLRPGSDGDEGQDEDGEDRESGANG